MLETSTCEVKRSTALGSGCFDVRLTSDSSHDGGEILVSLG